MKKIAMAIAILALTTGVGTAQSAPKPKPLPPDQAQAAIDSPGVQVMNTSRAATPAEALRASSIPGAVTEVAPGMTPEQATGVDQAPPTRTLAARHPTRSLAQVGSGCASTGLGWVWGTWPYNRRVNDYTYSCWTNQTMTYRTTHVTLDAFLCGTHEAYAFRLDGGVGYGYVHVESGGYFDCPTDIPWITFHRHEYMHNYYMPWAVHWTSSTS